jgi:hypothetical protein
MEDELEVVEVPALPSIKGEEDFDTRLRLLAASDEAIDKASAVLKELKARHEALSYSLAMYMMNSGCKEKVLDDFKFKKKQRVFSKVEDKETLREWIIKNDAVDLLMAVHPSKLTSYCNEEKEDGTLANETPAGVNPNFIKHFVEVKTVKK